MKKSEIINRGMRAILNVPREFERGIRLSANDRFMITSILLDEFIEAGMLPPPVGIGEEDEWGFLDYNYEWESEDE